ncbi:GATA zinc finger domain-containing protein 17-like [Topomyia yanbarensis]|uniref:GATA zinc finger domain-containing protein 17-like n=1 Tax=Topomyia yanbarensis TaxID=2498891 RepID=UPI00273AF8D4|nr:GATA zinc finger domain-containing protein 17-like [Topomyia yanbarensis]
MVLPGFRMFVLFAVVSTVSAGIDDFFDNLFSAFTHKDSIPGNSSTTSAETELNTTTIAHIQQAPPAVQLTTTVEALISAENSTKPTHLELVDPTTLRPSTETIKSGTSSVPVLLSRKKRDYSTTSVEDNDDDDDDDDDTDDNDDDDDEGNTPIPITTRTAATTTTTTKIVISSNSEPVTNGPGEDDYPLP